MFANAVALLGKPLRNPGGLMGYFSALITAPNFTGKNKSRPLRCGKIEPHHNGRKSYEKCMKLRYYNTFNSKTHSHSTNPIIWDCIFYVFTDKIFANLLMFHLLFLAAQFLSIKIVSQKAEKCNHIPPPFRAPVLPICLCCLVSR